jgi:hypothetical protein
MCNSIVLCTKGSHMAPQLGEFGLCRVSSSEATADERSEEGGESGGIFSSGARISLPSEARIIGSRSGARARSAVGEDISRVRRRADETGTSGAGISVSSNGSRIGNVGGERNPSPPEGGREYREPTENAPGKARYPSSAS